MKKVTRLYSYTVDGVPAYTREDARTMQRRMRAEGEPKNTTRILQTKVTKVKKYVR